MVINAIKVPYRILSSKLFLLWVIGCWISYYVVSAIWLKEAFGVFVAGLRENLFMQVPYVLFLISACLNIIRASKDVFKKSRAGFVLWLILPLGLVLFFTGFFMSTTMRESGQRVVGEGDIVDPPWSRKQYRVTRIAPGLKDTLAFTDISSGIFAYEPKLSVVDASSQVSEIGAFPPSKLDSTYYHILNFGIAPGVILSEGKKILSQGYMILRIITPGTSDFFNIDPYPYRFLVSMEPEKTVQDDPGTVSQFSLKAPRFHVRVFSGEQLIAEGDSDRGIEINNLKLTFFTPAYWVLLEAVKDPGISVMHAGVILITLGIPMTFIYLFLRRRKGERIIEAY
ncbi:MAG: hypothetical protein JSW20_13180 [Nitrospiraceae bacterium]|nr:MAG: hypothetical protein JSW20_13180 [Nitrospiraceae bacterium]